MTPERRQMILEHDYLVAEVERLRQVEIDDHALLTHLAALWPYIQHLDTCAGDPCSCGLDDINDALDATLDRAIALAKQA